MNQDIKKLSESIAPLRQELLNHPLYLSLNSKKELRIFMEQHVYAVWDFMSLLKALQLELTCISLPWVPTGSPSTRRFINEIVLGEESDVDNTGAPASHFELYIQSMNELGADTETVLQFIEKIKIGQPFMTSVDSQKVNQETINFMSYTFEIIQRGNPHEIAAVFTFGREDLIPDMFIEIVKGLQEKEGVSTSRLLYYLERHIEIDGGEHGPLSLQMIDELCENDPVKWNDTLQVSLKALQMRIELWNGILKQIDKN